MLHHTDDVANLREHSAAADAKMLGAKSTWTSDVIKVCRQSWWCQVAAVHRWYCLTVGSNNNHSSQTEIAWQPALIAGLATASLTDRILQHCTPTRSLLEKIIFQGLHVARLVMESTWLFQKSLLLMFKPRYLHSWQSPVEYCVVYVQVTSLVLDGLNSISHSASHSSRWFKSAWRMVVGCCSVLFWNLQTTLLMKCGNIQINCYWLLLKEWIGLTLLAEHPLNRKRNFQEVSTFYC